MVYKNIKQPLKLVVLTWNPQKGTLKKGFVCKSVIRKNSYEKSI